MQLVALLLIGFSLFSAAILILSNLFQQLAPQRFLEKLSGFFLILCLVAIQWQNMNYILGNSRVLFSPCYITLLYGVAPSFYLYSHQFISAHNRLNLWHLFHLLPFFFSLIIPFPWSVPLAFLIGSGYLLWLAKAVYFLRKQRSRFKLEILALAAFFTIALAVIILGFIWPILTNSTFVNSYSLLIGLAFFSTILTLLHFPSITTEVAEAAQAAYAESTLNNIDRKKTLEQLTNLMQEEKIYTLDSLSLAMLADQLKLTTHQLSELINTEFKLGFSKFIRLYRISEAKKMLLSEPNASVLSIGLSVGFSSQSNFYTAFHDLEGMAPGQYRKQAKL